MPKRKRAREETLEDKLTGYRTDLFRALKKVKGFERQRQSKHLHQPDTDPSKRQRLENEVLVLKSLDLHQTVNHYLCSTFTRIKSLANHPNFPDELRNPAPQPELTEEERVTLHHVTSCLFNRPEVKDVMEKIVAEACELLDVPMPEKKRGKRKRAKHYAAEDQHEGGELGEEQTQIAGEGQVHGKRVRNADPKTRQQNGRTGPAGNKDVTKVKKTRPDRVGEAEEKILERFDDRLGGSSDEENVSDSDSEDEGARIVKGRSIRAENVPDFGSSDSSGSDDDEDAGHSEVNEVKDESVRQIGNRRSIHVRGMSVSLSPEPEPSPPPERKREKPKAEKKSRQRREPIKDSTFLPTLMGGYISGSESASDVEMEVAPRKNRLGQRQRRLRAEKKYGSNASHLKKQRMNRDDGWDMKRGAVSEADDRKKPWKRGINNPLATETSNAGQHGPTTGQGEPTKSPKKIPPKKNDDLHPSWAARKKAKEAAPKLTISTEPTNANKIVFDD